MVEKLPELVDEIVRTRNNRDDGEIILNADRLKSLKSLCKQNDAYLDPLFDRILFHLRKENVTVRLYAVVLTDEMFRRSHHFREYVIQNIQDFLKFTVETDPMYFPLPPPRNLAKQLKEKTLKLMHEWYNAYGAAYRKLQVAYEFLKTCTTFDFQRIEAQTAVQRERAEREQERMDRTKMRVMQKINEDLQDISEEMAASLTEIDTGFKLLLPDVAEGTEIPCDIHEKDPISTDFLNAHGVPNSRLFDLTIDVRFNDVSVKKNDDTTDILVSVRDAYKLIVGRFLPKIRQLTTVLNRYGGDERLTKILIDWRQRLEEAKKKFDDLHLVDEKDNRKSQENEEENGEDFEVVPEKEGFEENFDHAPRSPEVPGHILKWSAEDSQPTSTSRLAEKDLMRKIVNRKIKPETTTEKNPHKNTIPVLPYGLDLAYWESKTIEKPLIARNNADCHRFWRPADTDEHMQCSELEALEAYRTRVITFAGTFEPVEHECRAPVGENKLCTRRDREKCPFHGPIVPRDALGRRLDGREEEFKPIVPEPAWQEKEFLRDIEKATGRNLMVEKSKKGRRRSESPPSTHTEVRERLERKLFNRSSVKRVATTMDALDSAKNAKKFAGQWAYVYRE